MIEIADGGFDRGTGDRASRPSDRKHRCPCLLHDWHEDLLWRVLIDAVLFDVADDADNGAPGAVALGGTRTCQPDLLTDWIFIRPRRLGGTGEGAGPKIQVDQTAGDDGNGLRVWGVGPVERASPDEGNLQRFEIVRGNRNDARTWQIHHDCTGWDG